MKSKTTKVVGIAMVTPAVLVLIAILITAGYVIWNVVGPGALIMGVSVFVIGIMAWAGLMLLNR